MYLPAFPAIEASYGAPEGTAQITLASWFAGLAVGQIAQGTHGRPVRPARAADRRAAALHARLGRLRAGAEPDGADRLRAVAAFGGSASMVLPRAIVRDLADGHAAARLMSQLMLVMGVAPILAPTLGGLLLSVASWRVIFWFAACHGLISLLVVWRVLPETLAPARRVRLGLAGMLSRYGSVLRNATSSSTWRSARSSCSACSPI